MNILRYMLRLIAGLVLAGTFLAVVVLAGSPEGDRALGAMLLIGAACCLISFLVAGAIWVLTDISRKLELWAQAATPTPLKIAEAAKPEPIPEYLRAFTRVPESDAK